MRTLAILLVLSGALFAQSIDSTKPGCGAEGDAILICGSGFGEEPSVEFNGTSAEVIKNNDEKILVRVPEGATTGPLSVDGTDSDFDFVVLADGTPVVLHLSATTATPGQRVFVIGRRLDHGDVEFVDGDGTVVDTAQLVGRKRAAFFKVPKDLAAGTYALNIVNGDGLETGDCSPELEVVEAGDATLDSIAPLEALPGEHIVLKGSDLGPTGPAMVTWEHGGKKLKSLGFSNGFDRVFSTVPFRAEAGTTYDVWVKAHGKESETNTIEYTVGTAGAPTIDELEPDAGPAGTVFRIVGTNLFVFGELPKVEMTKDGETIEAKLLGGHPGMGKLHGPMLLARVPEDAADGEYDVTVTVGGQTSNALTFEVGEQPLAVDSMEPTSQGTQGTFQPVTIKGSGFGYLGSGKITVTWDDGSGADPRHGLIVFRTDSELKVIPPGGKLKPLKAGTYSVYVNRGEDSVLAGTYTVQ